MHALRAASAQTRCDRFSSQSRVFIATDMCWSVPHMPATSGCTRSTQRIASVTVEARARKVLCGKTERRPQSTGTNL